MSDVRLRAVTKSFGDVDVIKGVGLDIEDGEFVVLVGPSGCGKSTLLRMIAGLETVSDGLVEIDGQRVNDVEAADRGIAMVFQSYALYPHMTVEQNMAFGLRMNGIEKSIIRSRIQGAAEILQLDQLLKRKPKQLSGGQRQRVAIGRAIVREPKVFLFDEPLSNLDAELRVEMRVQLTRLHRRLGATMIYVTHDQVEAMTMADRIVVLRDGLVEQVGSPLELYNNPANKFVAGFLGSPKMNFMAARVKDMSDRVTHVVTASDLTLKVPSHRAGVSVGDTVTLGIRPNDIIIGGDSPNTQFNVDVCEHLGSQVIAYGAVDNHSFIVETDKSQPAANFGDMLPMTILPERCHLFGQDDVAFQKAG